jgi:phosphoribosylanthranilate isomerase
MLIKICGITGEEAALTAEQYGADLIGFVFAPSRRRVSVATAAKIAGRLQNAGKVGVFVNQPLAEVREIVQVCGLDYVQLHGEETPDYCRAVKLPVIKALRVSGDFVPESLADYGARWLLLDSFVPGQAGGTGVSLDWRKAAEWTGRVPTELFLAGGLTAENVGEAIRVLQPAGVDVSGGVETAGVKDPEKIRRFISAARAAEGDRKRCCSEL